MSEYRGCELPEALYYDLDYLWARPEADGSFTLGLTDPSQTMAGRVQHVVIRPVGTHRVTRKPLARLESGKWAGGVPAPFDGTVVAVNDSVLIEPSLINIAPYTDAWLLRFQPDHPEAAFARLVTGAEAQRKLREWIDRYDVQCMRCVR